MINPNNPAARLQAQPFIALAIASIAHRGQLYGTRDFVDAHLKVVAKRVYDTQDGNVFMVAAAFLHDVLEDTQLTHADLFKAGVRSEVVALVDVLTRRPEENYTAYLNRVRTNRQATAIKIQDTLVNLENSPTESLRRRYEAALVTLRGA